jgi:hypothetical protein
VDHLSPDLEEEEEPCPPQAEEQANFRPGRVSPSVSLISTSIFPEIEVRDQDLLYLN